MTQPTPPRPNALSRWKSFRGLLWLLIRRYILGWAPEMPYTEAELRDQIGWDQAEPDEKARILRMFQTEFQATDTTMNKQFDKTAALVSALGVIIAALTIARLGGTNAAIRAICIAAIPALWALSPRLKVLFYRPSRHQDAGRRIGAIKTDWDECWYWARWLWRRESTTNAIEVLILFSVVTAIIALGYVAAAI